MHAGHTCLSDAEMGSYIEDRLSPEQKNALNRRLSDCTECRKEMNRIKEILGQEDILKEGDAPEHLMRRVIRMFPEKSGLFDVVVRLIRDSVEIVQSSASVSVLSPVAAPALRGIRMFSPTMITLTKSFQDIEVELNVEKISGDLCDVKVLVFDKAEKEQLHHLRVELISQGRELASSFLKNGEVIFEEIPPGRYSINIRKKTKVFGELTFKIV